MTAALHDHLIAASRENYLSVINLAVNTDDDFEVSNTFVKYCTVQRYYELVELDTEEKYFELPYRLCMEAVGDKLFPDFSDGI